MRRLATALLLFLALLAGPLAAQTLPQPAGPPAAAEPSVDDLIRLLENDGSRAALIARLRQGAAAAPPGAAAAEAAPEEPTLARQVAEQTRAVAERASHALAAITGVVTAGGAGLSQIDFGALRQLALEVALVAAGLAAAALVLRLLSARLRAGLARRARARGTVRHAVSLAVATAADAAGVVLAWAVGYALALHVVGGATGRMAIGQTLLLNAFLFVETVKLLARAVLAPRNPPLRPVPLGDTAAAYWYLWITRLVTLVGYTFLFMAPVLAAAGSPAAAQALRVLVMAIALVVAVLIVLQNRERVRQVLTARSRHGKNDPLTHTASLLGRVWHVLAIAYLVAVFVVWLVNPREALGFMAAATLQSLVAIAIGSLVLFLIGRAVRFGIRVPEDLRERLPLLEGRLRAFVPRIMQVVRTIVLILMVAAVAQAWALVDFFGWLSSQSGQQVAGSVLSAGLIIVVGIAVYIGMSSWVEYRLNPEFGTVPTPRERTLLSLFRNAFTIALSVLVLMLALAQIGVNIAPLLAGAGVLGLAIGFGAQKFVQDIITGAFIQFENIMNEGDVVSAGGKSGVVERLTIRSVSIRDLGGTLHLIPFSSVDAVSNMMKGFSYHVAEIGVAYREDIGEVKEAMQEAFDRLLETEHSASIMGTLDMQGLTAFGDSAITVRARIKTLPGKHWGIGRAYNEIIKTVFDARGIEIPFPHVTLYMGQDKQGVAPPLPVELQRASPAPLARDPLLTEGED